MKKLITLLLASTCILGLVGCAKENETISQHDLAVDEVLSEESEQTMTSEVDVQEWSEPEIQSLFESKADSDWNYIECVAANDFAYERVGVILYTEKDSESIKIAFMDEEGHMQHCGVEAILDDSSEFTYLGNGAVSFKVHTEDGTEYTQKITLSMDGVNVNFASETMN